MAMRGCEKLQALMEQEHADRLAEAALWVAHELEPNFDVSSYLQRLYFYADEIGESLSAYAPLGDVIFQLNNYLFNDRCFSSEGAAAYTPGCSLLHKVIDSRCGVPLSLTVIYLTVGRWLGLPLVGLSFPGRMLVKYVDGDGEVVIDPANGGMPLQEADLLSLLSRCHARSFPPGQQLKRVLSVSDDKTMLVCMLFHLKQAYMQRGELKQALWTVESILALMPGLASGFRDRGYIYEMLDCRHAAAEDYNRYLELSPYAQDAELLRRRMPRLLLNPVTIH